MPIYEYHCDACNMDCETCVSIGELEAGCRCPECNEPMRRVISLTAPPRMGGMDAKLRKAEQIKKRNEDYAKSDRGKEEHRQEVAAAKRRLGI